jgi:cobalt-zinc-cadmium efflux system outer membrane protein
MHSADPRLYICISAALLLVLGALIPTHAEAASKPEQLTYQIDEVIDLALERNPAVKGAIGLIEQSRGIQIRAGAYPNPTFSGNSGYGILRDANTIIPEAETSKAREHLTEVNGTIGQPFEWPAKRSARKEAAAAGLAGANAGFQETQIALISEVKIAFFDLLLAQRNLELAKQNLGIVEDVRRIVKARVRLGEAPQFDAIKAEVEVLKANQVVTRAENTVRVNRVILDTITAGALGVSYMVTGDFQRFPHNLGLSPLIKRMLDGHPAIQRGLKLVEQADRTVEFERHARVPDVTVNGSYFREIGREAYWAGFSVPTPVWYQRQGEIQSAFGDKRKGEAELLRIRNELLKAVNQHYQEASTTATLIEVFEQGLMKQSQEALRIAQFSFQQGASSLLEVLDAQRVQRQILLDYVQAQFDLSVALARLERAVGGSL